MKRLKVYKLVTDFKDLYFCRYVDIVKEEREHLEQFGRIEIVTDWYLVKDDKYIVMEGNLYGINFTISSPYLRTLKKDEARRMKLSNLR